MQNLPAEFVQNVTNYAGAEGIAWLEQLPSSIAAYEQRWSLRMLPHFPALSWNYVAPAERADGTEVVFKAGVPRHELITEIEALRLYDGKGTVRLLDADPVQGVLLIERLRPGTMLVEVADDEEATVIAAQVMRQFWRPVPEPHPFPTIAEYARALLQIQAQCGGTTGPFPKVLVEEAQTLFHELLASMDEQVLLHGDYHHYNVLRAERQPWLMIDPKGVVGERAFDVGGFFHNPISIYTWPNFAHVMRRRVDIFAEQLAIDRARIRGWGIVYTVLSAWWSYESSGRGWERAIACAEQLAAIA